MRDFPESLPCDEPAGFPRDTGCGSPYGDPYGDADGWLDDYPDDYLALVYGIY